MKTASNRIVDKNKFPFAGENAAVVNSLRFVGQTFSALQEAREFADYNLTEDLGPGEAFKQVKSAEEIFNT
jgi:hypothetical protein